MVVYPGKIGKLYEFRNAMGTSLCVMSEMSEMNSMMAKEGCEMEKEENWQEDRRWMTDDDVIASINRRK